MKMWNKIIIKIKKDKMYEYKHKNQEMNQKDSKCKTIKMIFNHKCKTKIMRKKTNNKTTTFLLCIKIKQKANKISQIG